MNGSCLVFPNLPSIPVPTFRYAAHRAIHPLTALLSANSCSGCPQWQVISGQLFFSGLSAQKWQCYKSFPAELHELIWEELFPNLLCFLLAKIALKALCLVVHLQQSSLITSQDFQKAQSSASVAKLLLFSCWSCHHHPHKPHSV